MARPSPAQLTKVLVAMLEDEGFDVGIESNLRSRPVELRIDDAPVRVFLWNIRHGGEKRSPNEYRVQTTRPARIRLYVQRRRTWLLGYHSGLEVFSGWDPRFHANPGVSSSLQVHFSQLEEAAADGMSSRTRKVKRGDEVVVAFTPSAIRAYLDVVSTLPPPGTGKTVMKVWAKAGTGERLRPDDLPKAAARREVIQRVSVKVRDARFRASISRLYRGRCAFCGLGAGLVEAAHIVGVGEGGLDDVTNGMALCPTHHTAFDKGLLLVDGAGEIVVNRGRLLHCGASQAEIVGLRRVLASKAKVPSARRSQPDPDLLAAHWERWYMDPG
jgi:putative restriction endonuclease